MSNTSLLVFPAHAGVIRADAVWSHPDGRFPRTRGGDPQMMALRKSEYWFSRMRGGDPPAEEQKHKRGEFSPHARG